MGCFIFEYISCSNSPFPNHYDYVRFPVRLWFTHVKRCVLSKWTSSPRWASPESYSTSFIYRGVYYFTELIEGPLKFLVQFFSCNRPLSMPLLDFSELYLPIKLSRKQDHLLKLKNPLPCKSKRTVCNPFLTF